MSQLQRNPSAARRLVLAWSLVIACLGVFALGERVYTQGGQGNRMWAPRLATVPAGELQVLPVQGNVHVLIGAGGNITVQAGNDGVLMVDTGTANMSQKVIAAMRSISTEAAALHRQYDGRRGVYRRQRRDRRRRRDHPVPRAELHRRAAGRARCRPRVDHFLLHRAASPVRAAGQGGGHTGRGLARQHLLDRAEAALLQRRAGRDHASSGELRRQQHRPVPQVRRRQCRGDARPDGVSRHRYRRRRQHLRRWWTP